MQSKDYQRARSDFQKEERKEAIKRATMHQFDSGAWHEITLTTIAEEVGWSRANMYVYYKTKEEIFLEIVADKFENYFEGLRCALPHGCDFDSDTVAEIWAGIASANQSYFHYSDALASVIETNVSIDSLAKFKSRYYTCVDSIRQQVAAVIGMRAEDVDQLVIWIYYHGVGRAGICHDNPLVVEALERIGREPYNIDFKADLKSFIKVCLSHFKAEAEG